MASMIDNLLGRVRDPMVSQGLLALGGSMMQAGAQGMPTGAAFGQGLQAYQQAAQGYQDRQREDQKYQREQELQALIDEAIANPTQENLTKVAAAGGPQVAASLVAQMIKPAPTVTPTDDQREYQMALLQGFKGSFMDYKNALARASQQTINVNTGQKGFDNEIKLRSDFRSEPIYKAYQETISAHSQIVSAIKAGTPAGDLAAATKLMKILDPGSVVRESELGMAMSATGLADKLQNYAQMMISGRKLTPQQRVEFGALAEDLKRAAEDQYNAKAGEYEGIASDYGLNPYRVTGRKAQGNPADVRGKADAILSGGK